MDEGIEGDDDKEPFREKVCWLGLEDLAGGVDVKEPVERLWGEKDDVVRFTSSQEATFLQHNN